MTLSTNSDTQNLNLKIVLKYFTIEKSALKYFTIEKSAFTQANFFENNTRCV